MKRPIVPAVFLLAGCAWQATNPATPLQNGAAARVAPMTLPPKCDGQKDTKKYSTVTEKLGDKAGNMCVPEFGGFSGTVGYGPVSPAAKVTLTTSTTDYTHKLPSPGKGTPILYVQIRFDQNATFGPNAPEVFFVGKYTPGKPYTEFGVLLDSDKADPCYAKATKSKYGGQLELGNGIHDTKFDAKSTLLTVIYAGKQNGSEC